MRPGALAALLFLAGSVRAETLTWADVIREARASSPALAAAHESVEAAASGVRGATAGFLPDINADGALDREGAQALDRAWGSVGRASESTDYRLGGSASWSLFEGGATWASRREAVAALARARAAYRQAGVQLRATLRQTFDRLVYDQRNLDLLASIKERLNRDSRYLEIQFRSGREPRWTFLKAQADEAGIGWQIAQAALDIATQQQALGALLGRDPAGATGLTASGELAAPACPADTVALYPNLERDHPGLLQAEASVEGDAAALSRARSTWLPSVRASAGYDWSDGGTWPPDRSGWNAGLSVSLPIFSGGGDLAAIDQARHAWIGSRHALDDERASARSSLFAAWTSYRSTEEHQPVFKLDAEAATERFRTVQGLYEAGQASYLDFEQAEGSLTQAQQRLLSGQLDLAQANTQFRQALGLTLDDEGELKP